MTEPTVLVSDETLAELLASAERFHLVDYRYRDTTFALRELQERRAVEAWEAVNPATGGELDV